MKAKNELARQIIHLMIGLFIIGVMLFLWKFTHGWHFIAIFASWIIFITYCTIVYLHSCGIKTPFDALFRFMGERDEFPGEGALWYLLGLMLIFSFLDRFLYIITSIYILAVGDSISAIFSYKSQHKYSFFKGRNWLSYLAFIVFTLPVAIFVGIKAIPLILICAVIESLNIRINDNFLIPLTCIIYLLLF